MTKYLPLGLKNTVPRLEYFIIDLFYEIPLFGGTRFGTYYRVTPERVSTYFTIWRNNYDFLDYNMFFKKHKFN